MRKLVLCLSLLSCLAMTVYAEGYREDFEGYNTTEYYNDETLEVTYGDKSLETKKKYIVNGKGGIVYSDSEAYTANAAENIFCYTKTGYNEKKGIATATAVFGGLENGWRGLYSNPSTVLDCSDGTMSELNQYNRRLAVIQTSKGNKVLKMNPSNETAGKTFSVYANDNVEFYENTKWSTDVYIQGIGDHESRYFSMSLTRGKMDEIKPLKAIDKDKPEHGRTIVADVIKFDNSKVYCFGEEAFDYTKKKWYTIEILLKSTDGDTLCIVEIKERDTGNVVYTKRDYAIGKELNSGITGVGYTAHTYKGEDETSLYVDEIKLEKVELAATLYSTREAAINGRGNVAIEFNSAYDESTVNNETIKVYCGETLVEGYQVSTLTGNRVKINLPVLNPATVYTVRVNGVRDGYGITSVCDVPFKTTCISTLSNTRISGTNVSFKLKNNSAEGETVYVVAVCENSENMVEKTYYIKVTVSGEITGSFENIVSDTTNGVYLYVVDDLSGGIKPMSDFAKINN